MWSIFGVKLNYIVIFEKSCNSSTLLMELFMICGHLQHTNWAESKLNKTELESSAKSMTDQCLANL